MPRSDNSICTSGRWPASTAVSQGLTVSRYSSPPFGSHCTCWNSEPCSLNLGPVPIARWIEYGSIGRAVRLLRHSHELMPPQQEHVSIPHRRASAMSADFPTRSSPSWAHCRPHHAVASGTQVFPNARAVRHIAVACSPSPCIVRQQLHCPRYARLPQGRSAATEWFVERFAPSYTHLQ